MSGIDSKMKNRRESSYNAKIFSVRARFGSTRCRQIEEKGLVGRAIKQCVEDLVERFGRRGTEPNELFRSEFGQNSFKIQEFSVEN